MPRPADATAPTLVAESPLEGEIGAPQTPSTGRRYGLGRLVARGGMGELRIARDESLDREVVSKSLRPEHRKRPQLRARFLREAHIQAKLDHPGIVPVYDLGTDEHGADFFTMRAVHGKTLTEVLAARQTPEGRALHSTRELLEVFARVALTVAFAHQRGVVHRDLKPDNVMLGDFGEVYVLDWGIAKPLGTAGRSLDRTSGVVTRADTTMGTFEYMAPEQFANPSHADVRADVFSLGVILYEVLTGEPFRRRGDASAFREDETARQRLGRGDLPEDLAALCLHATEPEPGQRLASALALGQALRRSLDAAQVVELSRASARRYADLAGRELASLSGAPETHALAALGRALALDPNLRHELEPILSGALDADQGSLPPGVVSAIDQANRTVLRRRAVGGVLVYSVWLLFLAAGAVLGSRRPALLSVMAATAALIVLLHAWMLVSRNYRARCLRVAMPLSFLLVLETALYLGPNVLVPGLAVAASASYFVALRADRGARIWTFVLATLSVALPMVASALGLIEPRMQVEAGRLVVDTLVNVSANTLYVILSWGSLATVLLANLVVDRATRSSFDIERQAHLRAWRLRKVVSGD